MIRRAQIWWADLAEPRGSEPGYRHPVLVLQRDEVNASRINARPARAPGSTLLRRRRTGLRHDCVASASQIATLNKSDLETLAGAVPSDLMDEVD